MTTTEWLRIVETLKKPLRSWRGHCKSRRKKITSKDLKDVVYHPDIRRASPWPCRSPPAVPLWVWVLSHFPLPVTSTLPAVTPNLKWPRSILRQAACYVLRWDQNKTVAWILHNKNEILPIFPMNIAYIVVSCLNSGSRTLNWIDKKILPDNYREGVHITIYKKIIHITSA